MSFSLLGLLNLVNPKDRGSRRLARDLPFGDRARQRLDVYGPSAPGSGWPVIQFIYGGAWNEGDRRDYAFVGRSLAALGYVVVVADYRVVPEVEYPAFLEDGAEALDWTLANAGSFSGDASRLALMGHSAGAYNAVMLALVPGYGVSSRIGAVVGLSGPYDFFPFDVEVSRRTFGAVPEPETTQPVNLVGPSAPPMFLGTGDADTVVHPRNSAALARELRRHGVAVEERHYPGLRHESTLLELGSMLGGRTSLREDIAGFLARQLA